MKLTITKTGKLSKCTLAKNETEVVLSEGIVTIAQKAFDSCRDRIAKLVISEGVTTIEAEACHSMTQLTELILPASLVSVQHHAFADCTALREVSLPDGLKEIGWNVFSGCTNLEKLHLPGTLTKLPTCVHGCDKLKTLEIPASVKYIGLYALLESCMEEITLPQNVEFIDSQAFYRNAHLKKVTLPASVTGFGTGVFQDCIALEEIVLPSELKIPSGQKEKLSYFAGCTALKKVSMTREHAKLFLKATAVQLKKDSMPYKAEKDKFGIFEGCETLTEITFIASDESRWSDGTCDFKTEADGERLLKCIKPGILEYTVPEDVTVIVDKAFAENTRLKRFHINDKVKRIDLRQFAQCKLDSLTIPDTLTEIADHDFFALSRLNQYGKREWTAIQISDAHPTYGISDSLLYLKKDGVPHTLLYNMQPVRWNALVIPEGIEILAPSCCEESKQTEVQLPQSLCVIGARAFANNRNLEKITLPEGLEEIGADAFLGCRSLMELQIPDSVVRYPEALIVTKKTVIQCKKDSAADKYAKKNKLDVLYVGQEAAGEGENAPQTENMPLFDWGAGKEAQIISTFLGGVDEVTLPIEKDGIAVKGYDAKLLDRVRKTVKSVIVPEGITEIPEGFFARCEALNKVVLPSTLKAIGSGAFNGCWSLKEIEIPEGTENIASDVFGFGSGFFVKFMVIRSAWGSAAHSIAQSNRSRFVDIHADEQTQQLQMKFAACENEDGTLTIYDFFGVDKEICEIPEAISGRTVVGIDVNFSVSDTLVLPKSIRAVPQNLLAKVEKLVIDPENPHMKADERMWYSEGGRVLEGLLHSARGADELIIPDGVEIISENVFGERINLKKIYIPASVRAVRFRWYDGTVRENYWNIPFKGCIAGQRGSYAERLADANSITFLPDGESEEIHALREIFSVYRITEEKTKKNPSKYPKEMQGGLVVNGYNGNDSEVWIPDEIAGEKVCAIVGWKWENLPQTVHIPSSVSTVDVSQLAQEAVYAAEDNPVFYSEDGKLYDRASKQLLVCPQHSDLTKFWPEMKQIKRGALEHLKTNELRLPEGVKTWDCYYLHNKDEDYRVILPTTLTQMGILCAKEAVMHDHQMLLLASCANCERVIVLDEQHKVLCILLGKLLADIHLAAHTVEGLGKYLSVSSDDEITLAAVMAWYDKQFGSFRLKPDDKLAYAIYRLHVPYALEEKLRGELMTYLKRTVKKAAQFAVDRNDIMLMKTLIDQGVVHSKNVQTIIDLCNEKNLIEWTAVLLEGTRKM